MDSLGLIQYYKSCLYYIFIFIFVLFVKLKYPFYYFIPINTSKKNIENLSENVFWSPADVLCSDWTDKSWSGLDTQDWAMCRQDRSLFFASCRGSHTGNNGKNLERIHSNSYRHNDKDKKAWNNWSTAQHQADGWQNSTILMANYSLP